MKSTSRTLVYGLIAGGFVAFFFMLANESFKAGKPLDTIIYSLLAFFSGLIVMAVHELPSAKEHKTALKTIKAEQARIAVEQAKLDLQRDAFVSSLNSTQITQVRKDRLDRNGFEEAEQHS